MTELNFTELIEYMNKIPAVESSISSGIYDDKNWWVKFSIDIEHKLAWNVVQEFGHIINYLSLEEKLPTVFYPVSAPPYMNGGPNDFLYWIIESKDSNFLPVHLKDWLQGRLPDPVDDLDGWEVEE